MNTSITLYGTSACHLCEEAQALLLPLTHELSLELVLIDIADDDSLLEAYGLYIPVLSNSSGQDLRWPFDAHQAKAFLRQSTKN